MKINRIEQFFPHVRTRLVKITTDNGLVGWGETTLEGKPKSTVAAVEELADYLIGKDPLRIEHHWQHLYRSAFFRGGAVLMTALSGIDQALWDIAGKWAGVPIYQLLGGACRDHIRMYRATGGALPFCVEPGQAYREGRPTGGKPEDSNIWHEAARILVQEWGFRCLKVHFGPGDSLGVTSRVDQFAEQFAAVREGAGPDVDVAVDIHNPHPAIAMQLMEALAPHRPLFVEEPMPVERVDVLHQLARTTRVPIAAGERWMGKWIFFDALREGALSVVQPDIAHAGGITECKKIAALAEASYAKVALHCPLSPLALAASIQLDATLPNFLVQEHNEVNDWRDGARTLIGKGYLKTPFALDEAGCVQVPHAPGLGIELDEDGLQEVMARPWQRSAADTRREPRIKNRLIWFLVLGSPVLWFWPR